MIQWPWFPRYDALPATNQSSKIVQSWDAASKAHELADCSVSITVRVEGRDMIHILDVARERLNYPDLRKRIIAERKHWNADTIPIEDKGSGTSLIQDLRRDSIRAIPIQPEGDKVVRMSACKAQIEAGHIQLPTRADWLEDLRAELLAFPHGVHDNHADALSQLINWTRTRSTYTLDNIG